jgi:uncharacterized protein (TIGR02145 family)
MKKLIRTSGLILISLTIIFFNTCKKNDPPTPPVISTSDVTQITYTSAQSGGKITSEGNAQITSKGICWNKSADPTTDNSKTTESGESLSFSSSLTQLEPGTTYYVRAYATNSAGTGYGASKTFVTLGVKPVATSVNPTNVTINSATINGSVTPDLPTMVTFEYGTTTGYGTSVLAKQGQLSGQNPVSVSADLTGLNIATTYHFRLKAENPLGITYSADMTFTTLGSVPSATATAPTNITVNSAKLNGTLNANYLATTYVFEWGTDYGYGNIITPSQNTINGSTLVNISADLTGLAEGTRYYFRISAVNALGTSKSIGLTFSTLSIPVLTTKNITDVTTTAATSGGTITADFGAPLSEAGVCWGTSHNPTTSGNKVQSTVANSAFTTNLTGLTPNTTYYIRAYATNSVGTGYGNELVLKTFTGTASDIDGNQYNTVTIGTQIWLAGNLRTTKYQNGESIATTNPAQKDITNETNPEYQWAAGAEESNTALYGRLYTWYAVTDTRNVCPVGWHVPTGSDWDIVANFLGGYNVAASKMKEAGLLHWADQNKDATNESGFTALPSGYRNQEGYFGGFHDNDIFWTSNQYSAAEGYVKTMNYGSTAVSNGDHFTKNFGCSVRCVKN